MPTHGTMQALVWRENRGLAMEEIELPTLNADDDEKLVRVTYCGVCGTDLHILSGALGFNPTRIMGHELVGEMADTGKRVYCSPIGECGTCRGCHEGKINFCRTAWTGDALGIARDGGWAQFIAVPKQRLFDLPDDIPMATLALTETLACVVQGFNRFGRFQSEKKYLVIGAGIIGILFLVSLYHKGMRHLSVIELNKERAAMVERLGLGIKVVSPDQMKAEGLTYDAIFDCSGSPKAFESIIKHLKRAGSYMIFGCAAKGTTGRVEMTEVIHNQWRIMGIRMICYTTPESISLTADLYRAGLLDLDRIGIGVYPLKDHEKALKALREEHTKIVFEIP